jgi:hypothetical protein
LTGTYRHRGAYQHHPPQILFPLESLDTMGLLTIIKKVKRKEKEMRLLMV